jgi:hypothetical protein
VEVLNIFKVEGNIEKYNKKEGWLDWSHHTQKLPYKIHFYRKDRKED